MIRWIVPMLACVVASSAAAECRYSGAEVVCDREGFRLLMDDMTLAESDLALCRAHLEDEREDRAADVDLERRIADVQIAGARREADYWRGMAEGRAPTWWGEHRGAVAWGLGVGGTAALAGGVGLALSDGDPAVAGGLVLGGVLTAALGAWAGW